MFVKSNKTKVIILGTRMIMPGVNFVPDADAEDVTEHPMFKALQSKGDFIIVKKGPSATPKSDAKSFAEEIAGMSAKDAVPIIKQNFQKTELEAVAELDERKSVLNAVEAQLSALELPKGDDEDAED